MEYDQVRVGDSEVSERANRSLTRQLLGILVDSDRKKASVTDVKIFPERSVRIWEPM
jgi:hypothetical protein